jgi:hypothetical protein
MSLTYPETQVGEAEERQELQAILQSGILKKAPNLQSFLEFVAEEHFGGRADQVKEYNIAVRALHRPESFDPESDTIVRVTAHALRKKLEQYYATEGINHAVHIHLPAGKYVLLFVSKQPDLGATLEIPHPPSVLESALPPIPGATPSRRHFWVGLGIAIVATLSLLGVYVAKYKQQARAAKIGVSAPAPGFKQDLIVRLRFGASKRLYLDAAGQPWITERYCQGGTAFVHAGHEIQGTDDPEIFQEGREGKFQCRIPVRPGIYQVQLLFADTAGDREAARQVVFTINNQPADALDVVDEAGGNDIAIGKVYAGIRPMSDGTIHLDFVSDASFVNAIEITPSDSEGGQPIRMLAGPAVFLDNEGNNWLPERFFRGGRRTFHLDSLPKEANSRLFAWERYGHFHYFLPVIPGQKYRVRLYFSEGWFGTGNGGPGGIGSRVFDVYCNGTTLLKDFDILRQQRGGSVVITSHGVQPTAHGMLELYFTPVKNYPLINAIEVLPEG